jgi:hypothetical protein
MPGSKRILGSVAFLLVGAAVAVVLNGQDVRHGLVPPRSTYVDLVRSGLVATNVGLGTPIGVLAFVAALLNLDTRLGERREQRLIVAAVGAIVCLAVDVAIWPTSLTGPTLANGVVTIPLPFDWLKLLSAGILGAGAGCVLGGRLGPSALPHPSARSA